VLLAGLEINAMLLLILAVTLTALTTPTARSSMVLLNALATVTMVAWTAVSTCVLEWCAMEANANLEHACAPTHLYTTELTVTDQLAKAAMIPTVAITQTRPET